MTRALRTLFESEKHILEKGLVLDEDGAVQLNDKTATSRSPSRTMG